jgi:hypothetical protein
LCQCSQRQRSIPGDTGVNAVVASCSISQNALAFVG